MYMDDAWDAWWCCRLQGSRAQGVHACSAPRAFITHVNCLVFFGHTQRALVKTWNTVEAARLTGHETLLKSGARALPLDLLHTTPPAASAGTSAFLDEIHVSISTIQFVCVFTLEDPQSILVSTSPRKRV